MSFFFWLLQNGSQNHLEEWIGERTPEMVEIENLSTWETMISETVWHRHKQEIGQCNELGNCPQVCCHQSNASEVPRLGCDQRRKAYSPEQLANRGNASSSRNKPCWLRQGRAAGWPTFMRKMNLSSTVLIGKGCTFWTVSWEADGQTAVRSWLGRAGLGPRGNLQGSRARGMQGAWGLHEQSPLDSG